jgi:hypothetical protein
MGAPFYPKQQERLASGAEAPWNHGWNGTAEQVAEKIVFAVILSEAKNLLVMRISNMQILRRLRLLRMTVLWEFFSNLLKPCPDGNPRGIR